MSPCCYIGDLLFLLEKPTYHPPTSSSIARLQTTLADRKMDPAVERLRTGFDKFKIEVYE